MSTKAPQYSNINVAAPPAYSGTVSNSNNTGYGEQVNDATPSSAYNPSAAASAPMANDTPPSSPSDDVIAPQQAPLRVVQQQVVSQQDVRYVNQYGQPIAAPTVIQQPIPPQTQVVQQVQQVQYVNQYGQPIAAPMTAPTTAAPVPPQPATTIINVQLPEAKKTKETKRKRTRSSSKSEPLPMTEHCKRSFAALIGIAGSLILVASLFVGELAKTEDYFGFTTLQCTFYEIHADYDSMSDSVSYGTLCNEYETSYYDTVTEDHFCSTQAAADSFITLVTLAFIVSIPGWVISQSCCFCKRCCCPNTLPKIFYIASSILGLAGVIAWWAGDEICMTSDPGYEMGLGVSPIMVIVAVIIMIGGSCCAK